MTRHRCIKETALAPAYAAAGTHGVEALLLDMGAPLLQGVPGMAAQGFRLI